MSSTEALDLGRAAYKAGEWAEAVKHFTAVIDAPDADTDELHKVYSNRCAAFMQLNDLAKAKDDAEACTLSMPTWAKGWSRLGECELARFNYKEAVTALKKANELDPRPEYAKSLSTAQQRLSRAQQASSAYTAGSMPYSAPSTAVPNPTSFVGKTLNSFHLMTRVLLLFQSGVLLTSFTADQRFLVGVNTMCVRTFLVSALLSFVLTHGRPRFTREFLQQVMVDHNVQRVFGGFLLYLGPNGPAWVALLLPELAALLSQVARLLQRIKLASLASKVIGLASGRLLDPQGNVYWKVAQWAAYMEVAAGCYLLVGLLTPRRNFMQLVMYWQFLQMRHMLESATHQTSGVLHVAFRTLDAKIQANLPGVLKSGYTMISGLLARQVQLPDPNDRNKSKCTVM